MQPPETKVFKDFPKVGNFVWNGGLPMSRLHKRTAHVAKTNTWVFQCPHLKITSMRKHTRSAWRCNTDTGSKKCQVLKN